MAEHEIGRELTAVANQLPELSVEQVLAQVQKIQRIMQAAMVDGEHYGVIPGTKKPTLLKPGAEKLCLTFRLDPQYDSAEHYDGKHLTVVSRCTLWHIVSGLRYGSGMGSCSTKESKYAYRQEGRTCPTCGKPAIIKGKAEYGGGWLCFKKQDGCGAKFADGDAKIESQQTGRIPNEDLPDQYNTVLKMANKRSLVAAVLNVTAASDIFTQDLDETAAKPPPKAKEPESQVEPKPIEQLRSAILDYAEGDEKRAKAVLIGLTSDGKNKGKSHPNELTEAEAKIALQKFKERFLAPQEPEWSEPGAEG